MTSGAAPDVEKIKGRITQITEGLTGRDPSKIAAAYAFDDPRFTAFEDHPPFKRLDAEGLKRLFQMVGDATEMKDNKYDVDINVYGDTAVVTGYEDWAMTSGSQKDGSKSRFTIVFIKKGSDWSVIHEQFTRIGPSEIS